MNDLSVSRRLFLSGAAVAPAIAMSEEVVESCPSGESADCNRHHFIRGAAAALFAG